MKDFKLINRVTAAFVFAFSAVIYLMTVQPTLSFWDCGEFIASAYTLSVPHPPGAPFHILIGKIFTMFPFSSDIGYRMNVMSVFSCALTVLFLYLISVKVINNWKGKPNSLADIITVCGASAIGALSYAFAETNWFNALEAEVYGLGTFLIGLCMYLLILWWEKADEKGSDKYLILVAYVVGLSIGIHLLVVQCIVLAGLVFYFRRYKYSPKSLLIALGISSMAFFIVYPGIVKKLPLIMSGSVMIGVLIILAIVAGVAYSVNKKSPALNLAFLSLFLIVLGYSTYIMVLQRANVDNLPLNENDPSNIEKLISYLNREQYGDQPLIWPRRYSHEPQHAPIWQNYTSDLDFMWRYQINHMFNRYLLWNYAGRESHEQNAGVDFSKFFAIPFILGALGLYYHFRRDKKLAFVFLMMFLMMGIVTALYQNQQEYQPRERDYFYVGAFFAFSLWVGIGVAAIIETLREKMNNKAVMGLTTGVVLAAFVLVPVNMLRVNYAYQDRSQNYFPFDYAYNLLQSVEKDAIIFTNTDNDTFPVWCLQAVYGIRTDVRLVHLSLAQTDWYNLQLKNERPYGSLTVPFTMSDMQLAANKGSQWEANRVVSVEVSPKAYHDTVSVKPNKFAWQVPGKTMNQGGKPFAYLGPNDVIVMDIIKANKFERPIYFANTVMGDNLLGLDSYLRMEGMAQRLLPYPVSIEQGGVNRDLMMKGIMDTPTEPSKELRYGMLFRGLNNKEIFYDGVQKDMIQSYGPMFIRLAQSYAADSTKFALANQTLDRMEQVLSGQVSELDYRLSFETAMIYSKIGNKDKFLASSTAEQGALNEITKNPANIRGYYSPYRILSDLYELRGEYQKAVDILTRLSMYAPNDPEIKQRIEMYRSRIK